MATSVFRGVEVGNGELTGGWTIAASGEHIFSYDPAWPDSRFARPISISMPLRPSDAPYRGPGVEAFFDNLIPDSVEIRKRFQSRFGTPTPKAFDLLAEIGRDCVGALQLVPAGMDPGKVKTIQARPQKEAEVAACLRSALSAPGLGQTDPDDFRISLAGAQEKTAFLKLKGKWHRPMGATPTSHIFKLPMGSRVGSEQIDLSASVENEWLCARIVAAFGIPVANCETGGRQGCRGPSPRFSLFSGGPDSFRPEKVGQTSRAGDVIPAWGFCAKIEFPAHGERG